MHRSFRYLVLTGSGILSGVVAYQFRSSHREDPRLALGVVHAAGADVLRSGLANTAAEWNKNWDFREPEYMHSPKKPRSEKGHIPSLAEYGGEHTKTTDHGKPSATRHLVFIRHGQYAKADEDKDKVLTHLGRQQAVVTGNRLQLLHQQKYNIDKIVISTMTRAKETGDIIRASLPNVQYEYCDLLVEGAPCQPEPPSSTWKPDYYEIFQDSARIECAFRKYFHRASPEQKKDSVEVYVCHANVIRYFVCRALQFPPEGWLRMSIGNCGITWVTIRPNGHVLLRSMGDTGHLSPNMITTS